MTKSITTFLISVLTPGAGYLHIGERKNFYRVICLFFVILVLATVLRLLISFTGLLSVCIILSSIHLFTMLHAAIKARSAVHKKQIPVSLRLFLTFSFLLISGFSFANKRVVMGFDILSMNVPVMQPAVLQSDKFIVDTWAYQNNGPQRGDIVAHSFDEQHGLYLNRIIAKEGDRIEIKEGIVFVNGQALDERYVLRANAMKPESKNMKEVLIPSGHYFVMGDNRDASFGDSRFSGSISIKNIEGKITDVISSNDSQRIGRTVE